MFNNLHEECGVFGIFENKTTYASKSAVPCTKKQTVDLRRAKRKPGGGSARSCFRKVRLICYGIVKKRHLASGYSPILSSRNSPSLLMRHTDG